MPQPPWNERDADLATADAFVAKWKGVAASELSTSQSFLIGLCELLGLPRPHPTPEQDYMFERPLTFQHADGSSSTGRVDLYRRGAFVLESKKIKVGAHTRGFDEAMLRAHSQAQNYARALPANEGRPPFLVVVDVGNRIELYSEFSRSGGSYVPFPDPRSHRISLDDLRLPEIRDRLRRVWMDPLSLDPSREAARVTRAIAEQLADLAKSLEQASHAPEAVAQFLMRCLFTMFAEDVKLLPTDSFRDLLQRHADTPDVAMRMVAELWKDMDGGGFSAALACDVLRFNGKLFKQPNTLPLDKAQVGLLIEAAGAKWEHVEPAIFGTLLERALSASERHKLGAHYTPRAYVERLVLPTVIEPLRKEWGEAQAAALTLAAEGKDKEAVAELLRFHHRLCTVRILDPACGSGNFLYVTLEHLKRLEGEVLNALDELGHRQAGLAIGGERADALAGETVDPHNLLGIELNPRAAAIAEVVLWIGYLQWHFRTRGDVNPPVPVIRDFRNIENRDAVLAYDRVEYVTDERGVPVTHWDGKTMKVSPVTGEDIPDETARVPLERYVNPRKATWPQADFVVGNPPFVGNKRMRKYLGDGYVDALRGTWPDVPESADFVMYWWHHAGQLVRAGGLQRFGLITTNSIRQVFNRRVLEPFLADKKQPLSLVFAIPDHPWVDSADGAAVRIAMTCAVFGSRAGRTLTASSETPTAEDEFEIDFRTKQGRVNADLTIGADVSSAPALKANSLLCGQGIKVVGDGFFTEAGKFHDWVNPATNRPVGRPFVGPKEVVKGKTPRTIIDFFGLEELEAKMLCPEAYQRLLVSVKPKRDENARESIRELWWRFGWDRPVFRAAVRAQSRFITTLETSKHRFFSFVDAENLCDGSLFWIALSSSDNLAILSSSVHQAWVGVSAGSMGVYVGNVRYNRATCFDPFPFPQADDQQLKKLRELGEQLDLHRTNRQKEHPGLDLTGIYNVLDKLRSGETLTAKERVIHEHGLVSVLRQLHDDLDAAVLDAYGWSDLLPLLRIAHGNDAPAAGQTRDDAKRVFDEAILERLVALNAERAAEEARGMVRWLRPEFQNPQRTQAPQQAELDADSAEDGSDTVIPTALKPTPWPKDAVDQVRAVADLLANSPAPLSIDEIGNRFTARGPWKKRLPQLLDMLVALGRVELRGGAYFPP